MFVLINNNSDKRIDHTSYDKVVYLGYKPKEKFETNEILVLDSDYVQLTEKWLVSLNGYNVYGVEAVSKYDLETNYEKGVNQIVLNTKNKSITHVTETGEILWFVPSGGHLEINID